ncbi:zinc finger family protein [Salix suchowensis]|uniref:C2H2-type domain-containing protein n=1 Tax=Salix koriyanagi TaxID=2511006 RepID=A0A9Q0SLB0_9ROSI|nr:zinc finger family protein [Salix suchowensis]KAJ6681240.1 hypothetical protein OIU74_019671 [Salix koriyanagi]
MVKKYPQASSAVKDEWERKNAIFQGEHSIHFSWPQRNYPCSFCKRQFSSAQALGGHMNVHRRDRAKLRQLPPWFFKFPECPTSNPNPNDHLLSSSSKFSPCPDHTHDHSPYLNSFSSPCCREKKSIVECHQSKDLKKKKSNAGAVFGVGELKRNFSQECDQREALRRSEIINSDMETGCEDPKEVLDLELRLGLLV